MHGRRIAVVLLVLGLSLALAGPALALGKPFEKGVTLVSTEELKMLIEQKPDLVLINTLPVIEYKDKTLPGSICLPYELLKEGKVQLPPDKNKSLVFF